MSHETTIESDVIERAVRAGLLPQLVTSGCRGCVFDIRVGQSVRGLKCIDMPCEGVVWMRKEDIPE